MNGFVHAQDIRPTLEFIYLGCADAVVGPYFLGLEMLSEPYVEHVALGENGVGDGGWKF